MKILSSLALGITLTTVSVATIADIVPSKLISSGAVLQREMPLTLWGRATPGEDISIRLNGEVLASISAKSDGRWHWEGESYAAGGPHRLVLEGDNRIELSDIYFGDVWLAAGQSNMEMKMSNVNEVYASELASSDNPRIRHFQVPKNAVYDGPKQDLDGGEWLAAGPDNALNFTAAGYFFARHIEKTQDVPVGIILNAYGGSGAQAWMSMRALKNYPHYVEQAERNAAPGYVDNIKAEDSARGAPWYESLHKQDKGMHAEPTWSSTDVDESHWTKVTMPGSWVENNLPDINGVMWLRKTIQLPNRAAGKAAMLRLGRVVDADTVFVNGEQVGNTTYKYPQRRYKVPAGVLKAGANTVVVRAVTNAGGGGLVKDKPYQLEVADLEISLQGEWLARVGASIEPAPSRQFWDMSQPVGLYNAMLAPITPMPLKGVLWYQGESNAGKPDEYATLLPTMIRQWREEFGQATLPFIYAQLPGFGEPVDEPVQEGWAAMRAAQAKVLAEPNTAMAVTIDLGDWNDIHPLNKKDVGERLALLARERVYGETKLLAEAAAPFQMSVDENGVVEIVVAYAGKGLTAKGGEPCGFAIAGADGEFVWAEAEIDGNTIRVRSDKVKEPVEVRYAWADFPAKANVYNSAGLPLMPFALSVKANVDQ
ncbi:sialate O-acetylesterase [Gilvimarinus sp. SDUM040013]|uniref:Sialate O-acetylesterase n=1 Tax=Gilvimarinus gilvus TaxID=3058038 RepID=A0ABU4RZC2_9GAMM|nr:sialate O-acetylesterase [Gilvimarinus sp. SDUM040013]MDO3384645.1 sialate O-acetylesterase [Gilvimarinus sp. SDUM040013]MDX6850231.1 sialate O-acetylesterase [Gilvimarinus sp. SDUM040013]